MAAFALLVTSCNKDNEVNSTDTTAMTISLVASGSSARATTDPGQTAENSITSMEVLVFSKASNVKERQQTINGTTGKVTDVTVGSKRVVVIANPSATLKQQLTAVSTYADLNNPDKVNLDLLSQWDVNGSMATTGLTMRGEAEANLLGGSATNVVSVSVNRVVAKVKLGTITVTPDAGYDATKLQLTNVHIEKARDKSQLGFSEYLISATPAGKFGYRGGKLATVSVTQEGRLSGPAIQGSNTTFFYVLPNDNTGNNCTLMTIEGTYDGKQQYYVFRINNEAIAGSPTTGRYLEANHAYTVNVTLRRLGDGSTDPETPSDPATLDVTVTPQNWVVVPTQNVSW